MTGRLFVVATPIGNLEDLSPRALATLKKVAAIYCEDTRVTAKLASRFELTAPRISCHEHNEASRAAEVVSRLRAGQDLALVSDAGTPAISDPGARLVAASAREGFTVIAVPGPSSAVAALSVSGLPAVPHVFLGFAPPKSGARRRWIESHRTRRETLVYFEAPHRLAASLRDAAEILGAREAAVAREMTKIHEEVLRGTLPEIAQALSGRRKILGECVVVVSGAEEADRASALADWKEEAARLAEGGASPREVAREVQRRTGVPSREVYAYLAGLKPRS